jgi:hypothetical protein
VDTIRDDSSPIIDHGSIFEGTLGPPASKPGRETSSESLALKYKGICSQPDMINKQLINQCAKLKNEVLHLKSWFKVIKYHRKLQQAIILFYRHG